MTDHPHTETWSTGCKDCRSEMAADLRGLFYPDPEPYLPRRVPGNLRMVGRSEDGAAYADRLRGQTVILSVARESDGRLWLHVSMAFDDRCPTWPEMARLKAWAIGPDRVAYSVHPPESQHVNIHPYALHLWSPLEGDPPLPEFSRGLGTI